MKKSRIALAGLLLALMLSTQACTYLQNRADDAMDIIDIGLTFSAKPQLNLFVDAPFVTAYPIGWGKVDCAFLGLGQGKFSAFAPAHFNNWGVVLYGLEEVTYEGTSDDFVNYLNGDSRESREFYAESYTTGIGGIIEGIADGRYVKRPGRAMKYIGTCPHYIHLGFVGIVADPRYWDMLDFLVGFTTLDLSQDDDAQWQNDNLGGWYAGRMPE